MRTTIVQARRTQPEWSCSSLPHSILGKGLLSPHYPSARQLPSYHWILLQHLGPPTPPFMS